MHPLRRHPRLRAALVLLLAGAWLAPAVPASAQWWWQRRDSRREPAREEPPAAAPHQPKTRRAIAPAPGAAPRPTAAAPATAAPIADHDLEPGPAGFATVVFDFSDTVDALARACDVPTTALLAGNRLRRSELRAGQALRIPAPAWMAPGAGDPPPGTPGFMRSDDATADLAREVWRGVRGKRRVALTFDAGGERDGAEELARVLREADAKPTFFMTGRFARRFPETAAELARLGPVHNHSDSHPNFTSVTVEAMRMELARAEESVSTVTGQSTLPFWRPPNGARNRLALRTAAGEGYRSIYWTVDSKDAYQSGIGADAIVENVLRPRAGGRDPDHHLDGAIILMHVGIAETPRALPRIIDGLRARGFELVTVEEILRP